MMEGYHQPVMPDQVREILTRGGTRGGLFLDATLGGGGHSEVLLKAREDIRVVGMDQDLEAITFASQRLTPFGDRFRAIRANFRAMGEHLESGSIDGIVLDAGVSSRQLDSAERGFSFQKEGPLDMRMDRQGGLTAADVVNEWEEEALAKIFWEWGEERASRRIARRIAETRKGHRIRTTTELADLVVRTIGRPPGSRIHPATRIFQAIRIAVNDELGALEQGLEAGMRVLQTGGRMVVISFHSLEDRVVKNKFREWAKVEKRATLLLKKPQEATDEEAKSNPRARSAKLRAIEKL
jgi:16S rRNA (cytosine1402-N4)-methyltransferase